MSNELVPMEAQDLAVARAPAIVLEEARQAAVALKEVIGKKEKPVLFNGEQYLEFEDWQTVGRFYGISPRVTATKYVEFGEVRGWEAFAEAVQVATDRVVSRAESMCLNDEEKWRARPKYEWHYVKKSGGTSLEDPGKDELIWEKGKDGKSRPKKERVLAGEESVPLFQLRSMAQTRACAKAMRNALAWVVVLAGFKPTPAEEMDGVIEAHRKVHPPRDMGKAEVVDDGDATLRALESAGVSTRESELEALCKQVGKSQKFYLNRAGVDSASKLSEADWTELTTMLREKIKAAQEREELGTV